MVGSRDHSPVRQKRKRFPTPPQDDLPQPYNAQSLQPAKKRALSPSEQPRKQKRPQTRSRITSEEREAIRQRQLERERERERALREEEMHAAQRGINDVVREHYNNVPQRGRDWRKTDSKIKGLRSFNNWVKSCIIQKFSPDEDWRPGNQSRSPLLVLDIGCGKGGDLGKWQQAPQSIELYVGLDPADVSIQQARERFQEMQRRRRGRHFEGRFLVKDCFSESLEDIEIIRQVGWNAPPGAQAGFDVISMMFCMHYAFETEAKARRMLQNVSSALKKGGRFLGCIPNSDILGDRVRKFNEVQAAKAAGKNETENPAPEEGEAPEEDGEIEEEKTAEWGNSIYRIRFPTKTPNDGIFRPAYGWKYNFFLDEAVEEVPEYVVPWEAFRALAEDYNLELQYHKTFEEVWEAEKDDPVLGPLSERMGVRGRNGGGLMMSNDEREASNVYVAFCFYKV